MTIAWFQISRMFILTFQVPGRWGKKYAEGEEEYVEGEEVKLPQYE